MRNISLSCAVSISLIVLSLWIAGCQVAVPATATPKAPEKPLEFDGEVAYQHVKAQVALGPRPIGTEARRATADYIVSQFQAMGWSVERQTFSHQGVALENVIAKSGAGESPIFLGAHYDTRRVADQDKDHPTEPVPGANDGASGVAVLLELARTLDRSKLAQPVWLVFFDGEDNGRLDGWDFSVGARHLAGNLTVTPQAVVVVDMIGDRDQQIYMEGGSDPGLNQEIWAVAQRLGISSMPPEYKWSIIDDHLPFLEKGIPAALLIDFDYPYWHTTQDTADKVSPESLQRVGAVLQVWLEQR